jgi:hypothetical protein
MREFILGRTRHIQSQHYHPFPFQPGLRSNRLHENRSHHDPILEGLFTLKLESKAERELSRYEKRRLRKAYERISRAYG